MFERIVFSCGVIFFGMICSNYVKCDYFDEEKECARTCICVRFYIQTCNFSKMSYIMS